MKKSKIILACILLLSIVISNAQEKELPKELIDVVVFTDAESCNASIDAIEKSFRKSVEDGVNKRLAQSAEIPGSGGSSAKLSVGETMAKQLNEQTKPATKSLWD